MKKIDIFQASFRNDVQAIHSLVAEGVDPNAPSTAGTIPLQLACQGNAVEAIKALLQVGANASLRFSRSSQMDGRKFVDHVPLMYAESVEAAKLLLDAGADLEARDESDWTPLVYAAHSGNVDLASCLLDRGANPRVVIIHGGVRVTLFDMLEERIGRLEGLARQGEMVEVPRVLEKLRQVRQLIN